MVTVRLWFVVRAGCAVVTVRLWFDCASRRCSGYGEAVVRLCGQLLRTVARESVWPSADQYELLHKSRCNETGVAVCLIRGISPNGVHKFSTLSPVNTLSLKDQTAGAVYEHNHC